jgi:Tfp pilus assembly protein FimV
MVGITTANINIPTLTGAAQPSTAVTPPGTPQVNEQGNLVFKGDAFKVQDTKPEELATGKDEPPSIKELREQIKRLQKQLEQEQKQLAQLQEQAKDDPTKMVAVQAKQASIATLTGLIMAATGQLLEALNKIGGSSAGGSVDTTA